MRVILSRKGFDSANGGMSSPIMPNNQLISLPIPSKIDKITYSDLLLKNYGNYYSIISALQQNKRKHTIQHSETCHLDPDIYPTILKRSKNWKPLFGQINASQTHLKDNFIGKNDLFLFFGWFRNTIIENNILGFDKERKYSLHVIFGYFQVDHALTNNSEISSWMKYHPHIKSKIRFQNKTNCIYVAKDHLSWNKDLPGAGPFFSLDQSLILTAKDKNGNYLSRSKWFFNKKTPFGKKIAITYHNKKSWQKNYFQSASIGQEFILEDCKEVESWAKEIIELNINKKK